ncbi:hypothetical protein T492DRAFT_1053464 [Pavlovales sp. CCMP2436]|nr:hypothetical protein T492DRAFT_1053464 [Pavlovales sp. CCMP2436]
MALRRASCAVWLVALAIVASAAAADTICGELTVGPLADRHWVNVPTYWLNLDRAVARAAQMCAQLPHVLAHRTCATRVRAVDAAFAYDAVAGSVLYTEGRDELRFPDDQMTRLNIAISLSHLKAHHLAFAARHAQYLVLEDDVDLLFFPIAAKLGEGGVASRPLEARSARGFAKALPPGWATLQLMTIQSRGGWRKLRKLWRQSGSRWGGALPTSALAAAHGDGTCPTEAWSAGAYLASAGAAAQWVAAWPIEFPTDPSAGSAVTPSAALVSELVQGDGFRVRVERVPWVKPCWRLQQEGPLPLRLNFVPDVGILHIFENYGPLRSVEEAVAAGAAASAFAGTDRGGSGSSGDAGSQATAWPRLREYIAAPPLVVSNPINISDMGHPGEATMHGISREFVLRWWSWWSKSQASVQLPAPTRRTPQPAPSAEPAAATATCARVAVVIRAHAHTPRLLRELSRYSSELGDDTQRAVDAEATFPSTSRYSLYVSVDTTRAEGQALARVLTKLDFIGAARLHTYSANTTLSRFARSMVHLRQYEPNINWAYHVEPMALFASWAERSGVVEYTHAMFVESDVGFSGNFAAFLRATERPAAGVGNAAQEVVGGDGGIGSTRWVAADAGVSAVARVHGDAALGDLLAMKPIWISGARYRKSDLRFWTHWNKSTPNFRRFFADEERRFRGPDQLLRVSKRLLEEMAHLSRDLGVG